MRQDVAAFRYRSRPLASIGAATLHLSLYVMYGRALAEHLNQLGDFDTATTVVRFTPPHPIPPPIVDSIVRTRMADIDDAT